MDDESGWMRLVPPEREFLATDDPLVRDLAAGDERVFPPFAVRDWWEHPGEQGPTTDRGLVGAPRQLVVTTERCLVVSEGSIERSVAMASIGGSRLMKPSERPLEESEAAVLVHSGGPEPQVCWSASADEAKRLMAIIFEVAGTGGPFS
jgi:hypothetical protein